MADIILQIVSVLFFEINRAASGDADPIWKVKRIHAGREACMEGKAKAGG